MKRNRRRAEGNKAESIFGLLRPVFRPRSSVNIRGTITPASPAHTVVLIAVFILVAAAFVFHLHIRFEGARLAREVRRQGIVREELLRERAKLRLEIASLKSPGRVESEARERLGMEVPGHDRIVPIGGKKRQQPVSGRAL